MSTRGVAPASSAAMTPFVRRVTFGAQTRPAEQPAGSAFRAQASRHMPFEQLRPVEHASRVVSK
jgi:hypothetical protein